MPNQHKRRFKRRPKKSMSFDKRVLKVINKQSEKKVIDQTEAAASITNVAQFLMSMTMPAQGDTDATRDGDQIRLLSIRWKGHLELLGAATEGALIRLIVLRLPATNVDGAAPTADFNNVLKLNDFYPRELPYKYKVLHDRVVSIGGGGKSAAIVNISVKMNELIQFDGIGANDIANFKYHLYGQTNHPTATELSFDCNSRLIYTDS